MVQALTARQRANLARLRGAAKAAALARFRSQAPRRNAPIVVPQRMMPTRQFGRNLQEGRPNRGARAQMRAAYMQGAAVKGLGRAKLTSDQMYSGGALSNAQLAPRGQGYYDAFANKADDAILANAVGPVTVMTGHARMPINGSEGYIPENPMWPVTSTTPAVYAKNTTWTVKDKNFTKSNSKILVFNCGSSNHSVGTLLYPQADGDMKVQDLFCTAFLGLANPKDNHYNLSDNTGGDPNLNSDTTQGVESIPLRGSLRIINTTEAVRQGGIVRILRYNGGILFGHDHDPASPVSDYTRFAPTVDSYYTIRDMIRDSARTRHYSGKDFTQHKQFNLHPADFVRSHTFSQDLTLYEAIIQPRFNTLLILIDDFESADSTTNNSYEVNVLCQRAGRFSPGSLHHNNSKELRAMGDKLNAHIAAEAKKTTQP